MENGSAVFHDDYFLQYPNPPSERTAVLFGNGLIRTLGSPSSIDLLKETVCPPCNGGEGCKQDIYCPFRDQGDYLPFPLIYEYLILKKQKRHPEADHGQSILRCA